MPRALSSVRRQTRAAEQVIVIDDGSADATAAVARRCLPQADVLVNRQRLGVSRARNRGIRRAACDWIAFLDSDDAWHPDKLARQERALQDHPGQRICHTDEIWIRRGRRVNPKEKHRKRGGHIYEHCLPLCVLSPSSVVVHRGLLAQTGLFDESLPVCEDYDLWLRITARHAVLFLDEPLVTKYGGHDDQLSRLYPAMDRFRVRILENMLLYGRLNEEQQRQTRLMLIHKLRILAKGAAKHNNHDLYRQCRDKLQGWLDDVGTHGQADA